MVAAKQNDSVVITYLYVCMTALSRMNAIFVVRGRHRVWELIGVTANMVNPARIRAAWQGRISGCMLGQPVEVLSFEQRRRRLEAYLQEVGALPLRDYVPLVEGTIVDRLGRNCCRGHIVRAEADDDINYTVMALSTKHLSKFLRIASPRRLLNSVDNSCPTLT